ncbi:MAG: tryptophan synthase subunit alpha, partial [Clostridiales bacterium]|nr:tryptophan synthase subunit alpha [Clostridiales bacterium]
MNRISNAFLNHKAFIAFVTAGDPDLDTTEALVYAMEEAGADIIELGIPFSDPVAEGPVIQDANERALSAGCTTDKLFDLVAKIRIKSQIPIVFLTYMNPVFTYGKSAFFQKCKETGVDGIIVPDLPYEETEEIKGYCLNSEVQLISLIAPTSKQR